MKYVTTQLKQWQGIFGQEYTKRNDTGIQAVENQCKTQLGRTATEIFSDMLRGTKVSTILEVGCNVGNKLGILEQIDNYKLTGIEPQADAIFAARKRYPKITFKTGNIFNIPFADNSFDLVFTSGVLIHIHPSDLKKGMQEIHRVSKKYIAGLEYFAHKATTIKYREHTNLLWKMNYQKKYLQHFPYLEVTHTSLLEYSYSTYNRSRLYQQNFLLKK